MPGIHLHRSNRLEALADALAATLRTPTGGALVPETVVVQSLGMRRWIQLELAHRTGVAMNVRFPFPAELAETILRAALPDEAPAQAFTPEVLPWRILALFPRLLARPAFASLQRYASGETGALKEFQLARKISALFDRYIAYRPEWLEEWRRGREKHWQALLWRELVRDFPETNPPALAARLLAQLRRGALENPRLPARVSVFGISSLPPVYLELLNVLGAAADVHLFLLEPTADYWADLLTPRERDREERRNQLRQIPETDDSPFAGNRLLASLCKTGRDFSWLLLDRFEAVAEAEHFIPPSETSMLGALQAGIYGQREKETPRPVAPDDRSLQVHCCHSPTRELEVLHDQLLALFDARPDLTPRDILVTMPDVETYAPFIDAVFGASESEATRIPYAIADRAAHAENSIAAALLAILGLVGGRFTAPAVLALLDTPAIRDRFEIAESDLPRLRDAVRRSGVRWGIDAEQRGTLGLPPFPENTWRAGLDRLLLGYALPGDGTELFSGVLPDPEVEGQFAVTLGNLVEFTDRLFTHGQSLSEPRSPAAWEKALRALIGDLFDHGDTHADELRRVSDAIASLAEQAALAQFDRPIEFSVVRAHLEAALADDASIGGFLAGRVTFCALKPMRSIPFRVICLLGMNDTAFPRRDRALAFDLTRQQPRRGDRSLRDDDRYLFLEAIFSARETLYLSYCGLSPRDNAESPPSVIVAELLDYLARQFVLPKDFVLKHRLQPFSAAYFTGENPRLFSYSADYAAAARQGSIARQAAPAFVSQPLALPEEREVSLEQLAKFLGHPARFFLQQRLGLRLPESEEADADTEPAQLDNLTAYHLRETLTLRSIEAGGLRSGFAAAQASGTLAPGYIGAADYGASERSVEQLLARIGPTLDEPPLPPHTVQLDTGGWHFTGTLADVRPNGLVRFRAGKLRPADILAAWVAHLVLQLVDVPAQTTTFHAIDESVRFQPVENADAHLRELLGHYIAGLSTPLSLFANASRDYAKREIKQSGRSDPLDAARKTFEKLDAADEHVQLAFRGVDDPLSEDFTRVALAVWGPILASMEELK